ncbi:MAG TPA: hypothetical protein VMR77_04065 [Patescibacteria group bacterium]|jgi:hypothetical protein|nr:hypothetical protein [Patescibacteria group bacterium]
MLDIECQARYILRTTDHGLVDSQSGKTIRPSKAYGEVFCANCRINEQFKTEGAPHFGAREAAEASIENILQQRCQEKPALSF